MKVRAKERIVNNSIELYKYEGDDPFIYKGRFFFPTSDPLKVKGPPWLKPKLKKLWVRFVNFIKLILGEGN